jgi:hypothetical protein
MAHLTVAAVRARVAAVVEALATPAAWSESRWLWDVLPVAEPSTYAHLHFAVGVAETSMGGIEGSRVSRGADGAMVTTTVVVRWMYRVRADSAVADYDAMLAAEQVLIVALAGVAMTDLHLRPVAMRRTTIGDGTWSVNDVTLSAVHRIAIQ